MIRRRIIRSAISACNCSLSQMLTLVAAVTSVAEQPEGNELAGYRFTAHHDTVLWGREDELVASRRRLVNSLSRSD